jgi:hypothetical protein
MTTHTCIKPGCGTTYEDQDPDPYYCLPCREENKRIAAEVEAKLGPRDTTPPMTPLQEYEASAKGPMGFAIYKA